MGVTGQGKRSGKCRAMNLVRRRRSFSLYTRRISKGKYATIEIIVRSGAVLPKLADHMDNQSLIVISSKFWSSRNSLGSQSAFPMNNRRNTTPWPRGVCHSATNGKYQSMPMFQLTRRLMPKAFNYESVNIYECPLKHVDGRLLAG